ncbi:MAG: MotA/TolQ/ExbB proton channel family protein [Kangiellaceae bacterium]|nr:MotA/TolQ/ExbB proton channel family protein [Kangiellaceae bacterium]
MVVRLMLVCTFLLITSVNANTMVEVSQSLLSDIKQSQQRLNSREARISIEKNKLAKAIRSEQQKVMTLRKRTAVNRRLVDDKTLALSKIQQRLKEWRSQDNYQKRLLLELAERQELSVQRINQIRNDNQFGLAFLQEFVTGQQKSLSPQWIEEKVAHDSGEIIRAKTLKLGPVKWFLMSDLRAGLLDDDNKMTYSFDQQQSNNLAVLEEIGKASINFDPTLERALQINKQQENIFEHIQRGGIWAIPIMLFALFALIIALTKVWELWRLPALMPLLTERIDAISNSSTSDKRLQRLKQLENQLQGAQQTLIKIAISTPDREQRDDFLLAFLVENRQKMSSRLGAIAITAAVSPLLGLLGTVSGMIETFQMMTIFGAGDPSVVSGGISKALITTELGLVVAIPALILHALLSRQIKNHNTLLDTTAIRLGKLDSLA